MIIFTPYSIAIVELYFSRFQALESTFKLQYLASHVPMVMFCHGQAGDDNYIKCTFLHLGIALKYKYFVKI